MSEATNKTKQCEINVNYLEEIIVQLNSNITDISTELSKCNKQSDSLQNDLKESKSKEDQCTINLKGSKSTIDTLKQNITDIEKITSSKLTQYQIDLETLQKNLAASQKEAATYNATNADLNLKIKSVNEKLTDCLKESYNYALEIISLKCTGDDYKKNLSNCQMDNIKISELYKFLIANLTKEELESQGERAQLNATKASLDHCRKHKSEIEASSKKDKENILDLTNQIASIRAAFDESSKKHEEEIKVLNYTLSECKTSLECEENEKASIENKAQNLEVQNTEYKKELVICLQVSFSFGKFLYFVKI